MEQNFIWLSTSLFCCKSCWGTLLKEGITPFITDLSQEKYIESYNLEFNYLSGENVRFAIKTRKDLARKVAKEIHQYFNSYFLNAPLPNKEPDLPVAGIFIPFSPNTIHYGLYKAPEIIQSDQAIYMDFQRGISQLMIEVLGEESTEDETILTFAFYLHTALLKVFRENNIPTNQLILYYKVLSKENEPTIDSNFIRLKYEENQHMLAEIYSDIMNYKPSSSCNNPLWLEQWFELCNTVIQSIMSLNRQQDAYLLSGTGKMVSIINKQLGIIDNMQLVLSYFIRQVFPLFENTSD